MGASERKKTKPVQLPEGTYDRLAHCEMTPGEFFPSIINRLIDEHYLLHMLLENPEKVLETIRKANIVIENRADIGPVLQKSDVLGMIIGGRKNT